MRKFVAYDIRGRHMCGQNMLSYYSYIVHWTDQECVQHPIFEILSLRPHFMEHLANIAELSPLISWGAEPIRPLRRH